MINKLPKDVFEFMNWPWSKIEPYFKDLLDRDLDSESIFAWLIDWTSLSDLVSERYARLNLAVTQDTTDQQVEAQYYTFLDEIYSPAQAAENELKEKLITSGLEPQGFEIPLRKMRAEAAIYHPDNLPLLSLERKLAQEYNRLIGAQTVLWSGEELTLQRMRVVIQTPDRDARAHIWRLAAERQLQDRNTINDLWVKFMDLRLKLAENAGQPDYRSYRWMQMGRLDYTPQDCQVFQDAIKSVAVPAATRVYEKCRTRMGVAALRPWDLDQDLYPIYLPPLPAYGSADDLERKVESIFYKVDNQLGTYFYTMRDQALLDLDNRVGKAPGAYCTSFPVARQPFIFMNAVGLSADVRTILHESGHAFHNYERLKLPYAQQRLPGLEFAEVASMAMELLAVPHLSSGQDALYSQVDANRFRISHLEHILTFWPYMAVVDAFQHWVYTHQDQASDPAHCDERWLELWESFLPGVDWCGYEIEAMTGWQRKQHIYRYPFYYVEYGLAQLGSVQIWRNALDNPTKALASYRHALSLGGTASLPELYQEAGAKFTFDAQALAEAVRLIEETITELEAE